MSQPQCARGFGKTREEIRRRRARAAAFARFLLISRADCIWNWKARARLAPLWRSMRVEKLRAGAILCALGVIARREFSKLERWRFRSGRFFFLGRLCLDRIKRWGVAFDCIGFLMELWLGMNLGGVKYRRYWKISWKDLSNDITWVKYFLLISRYSRVWPARHAINVTSQTVTTVMSCFRVWITYIIYAHPLLLLLHNHLSPNKCLHWGYFLKMFSLNRVHYKKINQIQL